MEIKEKRRWTQGLIRGEKVTLFPEALLGYLLGPTLAMLTSSVIANYFNTYMSNVLNINRWAGGFFAMLPTISVFFVVLGNMLAGRWLDQNRFRSGKARPLLLAAIPMGILALMFLFVLAPYADETLPEKQTSALVFLAAGYILWFAGASPLYSVPHGSMISLSTRNGKDRQTLAAIANAAGLAAMGLTSMILPFFLRYLFVFRMENLPAEAEAVIRDGKILYYVDALGAPLYDGPASARNWKIFALALMVLFALGILIEFMCTRERITLERKEQDTEQKARSVRQQAAVCFSDRYWILLIVFFFLYQLGGMCKNTSQLYFCQAMFRDAAGHYTVANGGRLHGLLSIIGAVPTALGMVFVLPLAGRFGKSRTIAAGAVLAALGGLPGLLAPSSYPMVVTGFVLKALGSVPAMYLSMAMMADVLEHQEAICGFRTDGFSMTFYGAIMAGMTGIAAGIINRILAFLSYSSSNLSSPQIRSVLPWLFFGVEMICYAGIAVVLLFLRVEKEADLVEAAIRSAQGGTQWEDAGIDRERLRVFNRKRIRFGMKPIGLEISERETKGERR